MYAFEHNNIINLFILLENIFDVSNSVQMSNFNSFRVKKTILQPYLLLLVVKG